MASMLAGPADREALDQMQVLAAPDIDRLPWQPVPECPGVATRTLWRFGDFVHALVRYAPGTASTGRPHLAAHHHIWVVSGSATMAGRLLLPGSYVHVPPGVAHPVVAGGSGCVLLQLHRPHPPREAELLPTG